MKWLVELFVSWWYVFDMGLKEGNCMCKAPGGKPVHKEVRENGFVRGKGAATGAPVAITAHCWAEREASAGKTAGRRTVLWKERL